MKKIFTLLIGIVFSVTIINAQVPYKFSFKATIVNRNGAIVANKIVGLMIKIIPDNYVETFAPTTNEIGQIDIVIGGGIPDLSSIGWLTGEHFLEVWVDVKGGDEYILMSNTQLLSVPYALYAGSSDYNNLTDKPTTVAGYGITDAVTLNGVQTLTNKTLYAPIINSPAGIVKADVGLSNVDNTTDASKPISTNTQTALDLKENVLTFHLPLYRSANSISMSAASGSDNGYMSSADKTKLDGMQNADGSETKVTAGTNITVTGEGTTGDPYVINSSSGGPGSGGLTIGDSYGGGVIFYLTPDGIHGLVVEAQDQTFSGPQNWYNAHNLISVPGNHSLDGRNYTDWRLPTLYEFATLKKSGVVSNFIDEEYWTSIETSSSEAIALNCGTNVIWVRDKSGTKYVRTIRSF